MTTVLIFLVLSFKFHVKTIHESKLDIVKVSDS